MLTYFTLGFIFYIILSILNWNDMKQATPQQLMIGFILTILIWPFAILNNILWLFIS